MNKKSKNKCKANSNELTYWKNHILKRYYPLFINKFMNNNNSLFSYTLNNFKEQVNYVGNNTTFLWGTKKLKNSQDNTKKNVQGILKNNQSHENNNEQDLIGNYIHIVRIEDGFIRSNGLGCKFYYPYSWVFDPIGIYFDPNSPSLLELMLNFIPSYKEQYCNEYQHLMAQAIELRKFIINNNISKYSQGFNTKYSSYLYSLLSNKREDKYFQKNTIYTYDDSHTLPNSILPTKKLVIFNKTYDLDINTTIIFIPGQVDNDASILKGGYGYTSYKLLEEVRSKNPEAFIIYKVHPDVVCGRRNSKNDTTYTKRTNISPLKKLANIVCTNNESVLSLIDICDEIHTVTSLVGFDALIRGKKVFTYGMPFYAGWGLTVDKQESIRRKTKLTIDELVATCLIEYPLYYNWGDNISCSAIEACKTLIKGKSKQCKLLYTLSFFFRIFKKIIGLNK